MTLDWLLELAPDALQRAGYPAQLKHATAMVGSRGLGEARAAKAGLHNLAAIDRSFPIFASGCFDFTVVVKCGEAGETTMKPRRTAKNATDQSEPTPSVRATISFPPDIYKTLAIIAKEKKVSLAWVVRDAAEKYVADKWPLLGGPKGR